MNIQMLLSSAPLGVARLCTAKQKFANISPVCRACLPSIADFRRDHVPGARRVGIPWLVSWKTFDVLLWTYDSGHEKTKAHRSLKDDAWNLEDGSEEPLQRERLRARRRADRPCPPNG